MKTFNRTSIVFIFVFAVMIAVYPAAAKDWSNRVENNFTVDGIHFGLGGRSYMNYGTNHFIVRYKFDDSWSSQYRYVTIKAGDAIEHWFRMQHKDFSLMAFFWNSRIEYRIKEATDDVFRYRPQTGFKFDVLEKIKAYYVAEPHWEYDLGKSIGYFKFAQHFFGFDIKLDTNVSFGPFIEIDTNDNWEKELVFLGTQLEVIIK